MTQLKNSNPERKPRVKKSDWLNAALDVLKKHGIEAVRVERLAAQLSVSKSGFYYHFSDRQELHKALIEHWRNFDGRPVEAQRGMRDLEPEYLLQHTVEMVEKLELRQLDFAIRQWAQSDPGIAKIYRAEMRGRVRHVSRIFSMLGFEGDALSMRAITFVAYTTTEQQLFPDLRPREKQRLWDLRIKMLTRRD